MGKKSRVTRDFTIEMSAFGIFYIFRLLVTIIPAPN